MTEALKIDAQKEDVAETWEFILYISGQSPKSRNTLATLEKICEEYLKLKCKIEVIDLQKTPQFAVKDQILAIPTIVRKNPKPIKRVIGDLSNMSKALITLDIENVISKNSFQNKI